MTTIPNIIHTYIYIQFRLTKMDRLLRLGGAGMGGLGPVKSFFQTSYSSNIVQAFVKYPVHDGALFRYLTLLPTLYVTL